MATLSPDPRGRPTPHPAANSRRGDQVLLTSWHAGSGRPEEGESPAQAAWQAASAQQQIQAGLQGGERAQRGPSGGRPQPLPRTRRRASSSIAALGGLGRSGCTALAPGGGEDGAFCSSPPGSAQPQLVLPLTARPLAARAACARAPVTLEGGTVGRGCGAGAGRGAGTREPGAGGAS